eukprot:TRINITY_DN589_c0_g2_i4.p1 TRINITY_DN589_c0_g2~~TRINITY_DN589_c0_g2_i4.p1  ORF type:complete len:103 (-),score=24.51 TRINITY_DN589_c0_g2_i4:4-312(-)
MIDNSRISMQPGSAMKGSEELMETAPVIIYNNAKKSNLPKDFSDEDRGNFHALKFTDVTEEAVRTAERCCIGNKLICKSKKKKKKKKKYSALIPLLPLLQLV